jgi:UDP-glucose 4-epimerase
MSPLTSTPGVGAGHRIKGEGLISGERCLVTGGAGAIGSTIVDHLLAAGAAHVTVLDDLSSGSLDNLAGVLSSDRVTFTEGDIRDGKLVRRLMAGTDLVFHQAAIKIIRCIAEPRLALEVLAAGTFEVADAAAAAGVRKMITASSASVYGLADEFPTPERHHPYNNELFYGAAKLFNEGMLRSLHTSLGLDYVALRYFNVYGPRMDIHGGIYTEVLPRWMKRIDAGLPPLIDGDGSNSRDFVYISDIARGNLLAAASDVTDEVFNLGSGTETSLSELAGTLLRVMGSNLEPEYGPMRVSDPVPRRVADASAAKSRLGWKPEFRLEEGLRRLVSWWRNEAA